MEICLQQRSNLSIQILFLKKEGFEDFVSHVKGLIFCLFSSFSKTEYELLQELYSFKKPHRNATEVWYFLVGRVRE